MSLILMGSQMKQWWRSVTLSIKLITPKNLYGRFLLIIFLPFFLVQVIGLSYFFDSHLTRFASRLSLAIAGDVAFIMEQLPQEVAREYESLRLRVRRDMDILIKSDPPQTLPPPPSINFWWLHQRELLKALEARLPFPFVLNADISDGWADIYVQDGTKIIHFLVAKDRLYSSTGRVFVIWWLGSGVFLLMIALVFMSNQIRPIRRLARVADRFGRGDDVSDFRPSGAREVRQAGHAFMIMQQRIKRQINQRTIMLAGVSHDLRTPLTRMKLQLAMVPDSLSKELEMDLNEMETMIEEYLSFVHDMRDEAPSPIVLGPLLTSLVSEFRKQGLDVDCELEPIDTVIASLRVTLFRRGISNILSNAQRYATRAFISAQHNEQTVTIYIDDDGPGISTDEREVVFEPFYRQEPSRNVRTGGVGLGLTVAREVIMTHGGDISLADSPRGGLRCMITLPIDQGLLKTDRP
ncbi:MAG: ATP-binding protein [Pseudomonadota bacterium]